MRRINQTRVIIITTHVVIIDTTAILVPKDEELWLCLEHKELPPPVTLFM